MTWKKDFRTALALETDGLVIAGAGSSVSLTGYSFPRLVRPSLLERLVEFKNTMTIALRRTPDYTNCEHTRYGPDLKEQFRRFSVEREIILNSMQQV
jgi:hypothetical protein